MLNYATIDKRWRNATRNAESDVQANIGSDHYPLVIDLQVRLKAQEKRKAIERKRYLKCNKEQRDNYNWQLGETWRGEGGYAQLVDSMQSAAEKTVPLEIRNEMREPISQGALNMLGEKGQEKD